MRRKKAKQGKVTFHVRQGHRTTLTLSTTIFTMRGRIDVLQQASKTLVLAPGTGGDGELCTSEIVVWAGACGRLWR